METKFLGNTLINVKIFRYLQGACDKPLLSVTKNDKSLKLNLFAVFVSNLWQEQNLVKFTLKRSASGSAFSRISEAMQGSNIASQTNNNDMLF